MEQDENQALPEPMLESQKLAVYPAKLTFWLGAPLCGDLLVRLTRLLLKEQLNKGQTQKGEEEKKKKKETEQETIKPVGTITEGEEGRMFPGK